MSPWFRVFGTNTVEPDPAALLGYLEQIGHRAAGRFRRDDLGWLSAELTVGGCRVEIDRFLTSEPDIRRELNNWAAWLETKEHIIHHVPLMQQMIATTQLFTIRGDESGPLCRDICVILSQATEGVFQIDDQGFFDRHGNLLIAESPAP